MSGPFCGTCKHFIKPMLGDKTLGECGDRSKVVYTARGSSIKHSASEVNAETDYCTNHTAMSVFPYERQLRAALAGMLEAFENRGEETSLHEWHERMKAAAIHARVALGNERPVKGRSE